MQHNVTNLRVNRNLAGPDNDQAWQCHGGGKRHVHGNAPNKMVVKMHDTQTTSVWPSFFIPGSSDGAQKHSSCRGYDNCVGIGATCMHGTTWRRGETKTGSFVGSHVFKLSGNPNAKSGHAESSPHMKPLARAYVRVLRPRA